MATAEERMKILKMIEEGKISAKDGADLLRALEKDSISKTSEPLKGASPAKWFRVRITDVATGKNKVNINIPMGLVNVGMKMGARFAPEVEGVDFDELTAMIQGGAQGKVVDIIDNEEGEHVEIFVE
ncbi:MAG TPA: hypothetical protein VMZ24_04815 [Patescibacteria group bacterium]|nr:hypothetical protein [Patescibacteria group bacterium]